MAFLPASSGSGLERARFQSLNSIQRFTRAAADASLKLNTSERILTASDDALSFSTSRKIRLELSSLTAVDLSAQANLSTLSLARNGLDKIVDELGRLTQTVVRAQTSTSSQQAELQRQVDQSLEAIDIVARQTSIGKRSLLDGSSTLQAKHSIAGDGTITDFSIYAGGHSLARTSGIQGVRVKQVNANAAPIRRLNDQTEVLSLRVSILSANKAVRPFLQFTAGTAADSFAEFRLTGKLGSTTLKITSTQGTSPPNGSVLITSGAFDPSTFNSLAQETGLIIAPHAGVAGIPLAITTVGIGSDEFIKVELIDKSDGAGTAAQIGNVGGGGATGAVQTSFGTGATARINGLDVPLTGSYGTTAHYNHQGTDLEIDFGTRNLEDRTTSDTAQFNVSLDQGVKGLIANSANSDSALHYGFAQVTTDILGKGNAQYTLTAPPLGIGFTRLAGFTFDQFGGQIAEGDSLAELSESGRLALTTGKFNQALRTIERAQKQILDEQSRLGRLSEQFLQSIEHASTAMANLTSADSDIIGVDAATEIVNLLQSSLGVNTAMSSIDQLSNLQSSVLSLLEG